jgi:hypothetical protein
MDQQDKRDANIVTAAEFAQVDWQGPLEGSRKVDAHDLSDIYRRLLPKTDAPGPNASRGPIRLLFDLCGIALRPADRAQPWGAFLSFADGQRSSIPGDFGPAQWAVVRERALEARNPGLRARLADLVWSQNRRDREMAEVAVEAYCQILDGLLDGQYDSQLPRSETVDFDDVAFALRAIQVARATQKGREIPDRPKTAALRVYGAAKAARAFAVFIDIAGVALQYGLLPAAQIGADADVVGAEPTPESHAMAVQGVWSFAAEAYRHAKQDDDQRRCELRAVDFTLARARAAPSALVASHFLRAAIGELRHVRDTHPQRVALERELRERQRESVGEMRGPGIRIDLTDLANAQLGAFRTLSLSETLLHFGFVADVKTPQTLEAEAREGLRSHPLSNLFGTSHHDADGKVIGSTPSGGLDGEPAPELLSGKMREIARHHREIASAGSIEPVRAMIGARFDVNERDLWPIVTQSFFVPPAQAPLFVLGFTRFFQGDLMSAAHLLLPQIEPAMRHVLQNLGEEPTLLQADLLQEDRSLSRMLDVDREALEEVFGPALLQAIDHIFNQKPPGLRHAMAHGLITAGECFSREVTFAIWFLYHLTCAPLADHWDEMVSPNLRTTGWSSDDEDEPNDEPAASPAPPVEGDA